MTDVNTSFNTEAAILADGTLRAWSKTSYGEGGYEFDYTLSNIGKGYRALGRSCFLKSDGTAWNMDNPGAFLENVKVLDHVTQIMDGIFLKDDGTVWSDISLNSDEILGWDEPVQITGGAKRSKRTAPCGPGERTTTALPLPFWAGTAEETPTKWARSWTMWRMSQAAWPLRPTAPSGAGAITAGTARKAPSALRSRSWTRWWEPGPPTTLHAGLL